VALIWVEGFTGEKALAALWRQYAVAKARSEDKQLTVAVRCAAHAASIEAEEKYQAVVSEATTALVERAKAGCARTHALIVGVGDYKEAGIEALTTSVLGAWSFTEWILTRFQQPNRPLGSVELIASPTPEQGEWSPPKDVALQLGLKENLDQTLATEPATFKNIEDAFGKLLCRAGTLAENAAFFYFSGHGIWKSELLLLPEDARLPSGAQGTANLINIEQTQKYMFNKQPSVQCFFLDVCQETPLAVLENSAASPGEPLCRPANARAILKRDAWRYCGSCMGRKAYGPQDGPPYFTQELMTCLERRAVDPTADKKLAVTTNSLRVALEAAGSSRSEREKRDISFSAGVDATNFNAQLSEAQEPLEVFIKLGCEPSETTENAKLYVKSDKTEIFRSMPLKQAWYISVSQKDWQAGANFDSLFTCEPLKFKPIPPLHQVRLQVEFQASDPDTRGQS
jgi:Caspase domain